MDDMTSLPMTHLIILGKVVNQRRPVLYTPKKNSRIEPFATIELQKGLQIVLRFQIEPFSLTECVCFVTRNVPKQIRKLNTCILCVRYSTGFKQ